jgi:ubiquinone biosynthesis protein UbiJ
VIETDAATLSAVIWERRELADALRAGDIAIEGDQDAVTRFLDLFPAPAPASC